MTVLTAKPLILRDVELTLGVAGDDFAAFCSQVEFTPAGSQVTWTGLNKNTVTEATTPTWTVALGYAQDWDSAKSLSRYLYDNTGTTVTATFRPRRGTGPTFTSTLSITDGAIGGSVNGVAATTVQLGCTRPTITP